MESVTRNVRDLDQSDRSALERVLGHPLDPAQQIVLSVVNSGPIPPDPSSGKEIPPWWNIYEGLDDEEVDRIDAVIRQRADLTRTFE